MTETINLIKHREWKKKTGKNKLSKKSAQAQHEHKYRTHQIELNNGFGARAHRERTRRKGSRILQTPGPLTTNQLLVWLVCVPSGKGSLARESARAKVSTRRKRSKVCAHREECFRWQPTKEERGNERGREISRFPDSTMPGILNGTEQARAIEMAMERESRKIHETFLVLF